MPYFVYKWSLWAGRGSCMLNFRAMLNVSFTTMPRKKAICELIRRNGRANKKLEKFYGRNSEIFTVCRSLRKRISAMNPHVTPSGNSANTARNLPNESPGKLQVNKIGSRVPKIFMNRQQNIVCSKNLNKILTSRVLYERRSQRFPLTAVVYVFLHLLLLWFT